MSKIDENSNGQGNAGLPDSLKSELENVRKMTEGTFAPSESDAANNGEDGGETPPAKKPDATDTPDEPVVTPAKDDEGDEGDDDDEGDTGKDDDQDDSDGTDGKDEPDGTKKDRKVVPIKLFHDESRRRKEAEDTAAQLTKRVADLESIATDTKQGSQKEADAVKKWAEKNGYEAEEIEDLVKIIRANSEVDQETVLKNVFGDGTDIETIKAAFEMAKVTTENAVFETQFAEVAPEIKKAYPNATPEQLAEAKKKLDDISHSEWGHDKDLDYIVFKKKDAFDKIFKEPIKPKVGPEGSRPGQGAPRGYTAKDFMGKDAKPFTELSKLPEADQKQIISEMDPFTKVAYWQSLGGNTGETVKRGGKTIAKI